ncbi:hypothetical protein D3C72_2532290 [compost metagenome]
MNGTCRAASGSTTAMYSLYMSKVDAVTNSGVSRTVSGMVRAAISSQNQTSLPAIRSLANPKAASMVHT